MAEEIIPQDILDDANSYMMHNFPDAVDIGWHDGEDAYIQGRVEERAKWQKEQMDADAINMIIWIGVNIKEFKGKNAKEIYELWKTK